jgi:hypothetical protein
MKKRTLIPLLGISAFFVATFFTACYPGDDVSYSDLDLVTTAYDDQFDFKQAQTYYMYDSVVHIKDTLDDDNNVELGREFDDMILDLVKTNMSDYGYTLVTDPENNHPDLYLTVSAMASKNYVVYQYYPYYYWGWGWGWYYKDASETKGADYYGGWWGYYPPYWGGGYVTSYTVGSLIMNMHDVRDATPETDSIPTVWIGDINGLLGSSASTTQNRLDYNINKAFEQSPYLKNN